MVEFYQNTSLGYLFIILVLAGVYWIIHGALRKHFLLGLSFSFLFLFSPVQACIVFALLIISFLLAEKLRGKSKWFLIFPIGILLLNLALFKYFDFGVLAEVTFLGISYFTFRMIHFVVEVYRGGVKDLSFLDYLNYVIFFPTFSAGPIHRYDKFNSQLIKFNFSDFTKGFERILVGLFKKLVIADTLVVFTRQLSEVEGLSTGQIWLYVYLLSIQIYIDFSGYSDIAIGMARLFGYKVMENFNWPYLKHNLSIF